MFVRVKTVVQDGRSYEYLQIVRSVRDGTRVRQELVASLGRRDLLVATGQLDQLLQALARFSTRLRVVEAAKDERFVARQAKSWGPALVFGRLWQRQGLPEMLGRLAAGRRFGFDPERVAFALALQRLCAPGSDLQGAAWAQTVEAPGFDGSGAAPLLPHACRGWRRSATSSSGSSSSRTATCSRASSTWCSSTPPRSTSTATARAHLVRHGYSRDRRPDLPQLVLCVAVDGQGWPVACDVLPGNTADIEALSLTIARFRERFRIRRAVVVADRGMLGKATLAQLRDHVDRALRLHPRLSLAPRAGGRRGGPRPARALPGGRGQPRGQGGQARRAPLRGLPQPDRGQAGRRRPRGAARQAAPDARARRPQGGGRQSRLRALPSRSPRAASP